jgi:hypothetical protein
LAMSGMAIGARRGGHCTTRRPFLSTPAKVGLLRSCWHLVQSVRPPVSSRIDHHWPAAPCALHAVAVRRWPHSRHAPALASQQASPAPARSTAAQGRHRRVRASHPPMEAHIHDHALHHHGRAAVRRPERAGAKRELQLRNRQHTPPPTAAAPRAPALWRGAPLWQPQHAQPRPWATHCPPRRQ